jgi:hypothetical protein
VEFAEMTLSSSLVQWPWSTMANTLFFIGSIMWIVSACVCDEAGTSNDWSACEATALAATSCFFIDAILYFAAWWAMKRMGRENPFGSSLMARSSTGWQRALHSVDYLFWGNVMFFVGTGLDFTTSYFSYTSNNVNAPDLAGSTYVLSMLLWMGYAAMEIVRATLNLTNRRALGCAMLISFRVSSSPAQLCKLGFPTNVRATVFPWDLIGAILFQVASMFYMVAAFVCWTTVSGLDSFSCLPFELCGAVLFLLNSVVLFIDDAVLLRYHRNGLFELRDGTDSAQSQETTPILTHTDVEAPDLMVKDDDGGRSSGLADSIDSDSVGDNDDDKNGDNDNTGNTGCTGNTDPTEQNEQQDSMSHSQ